MAVELVVAAPAFIALLLLIGIGGQFMSVTGEVSAAARDAARQASLEVNYGSVQPTAQSVAQGDLTGVCTAGTHAAQSNADLLPGPLQATPGTQMPAAVLWVSDPQAVQVTVNCNVSLAVFAFIGISASHTFVATATAPLDPFSPRTNT